MSGRSHFPTIPRLSRERQLYRPVSTLYRVGEQTAEVECASVKDIPSAHQLVDGRCVESHLLVQCGHRIDAHVIRENDNHIRDDRGRRQAAMQ